MPLLILKSPNHNCTHRLLWFYFHFARIYKAIEWLYKLLLSILSKILFTADGNRFVSKMNSFAISTGIDVPRELIWASGSRVGVQSFERSRAADYLHYLALSRTILRSHPEIRSRAQAIGHLCSHGTEEGRVQPFHYDLTSTQVVLYSPLCLPLMNSTAFHIAIFVSCSVIEHFSPWSSS